MSQEIPIRLSDDMVRAILAGRKTQTRRPVKLQHVVPAVGAVMPRDFSSIARWKGCDAYLGTANVCVGTLRSTLGLPGDLLRVRECWASWTTPLSQECIAYRADGKARLALRDLFYDGALLGLGPACELVCPVSVWRSSTHMPKKAARIWLRVKRVWVERVQDISEADAEAEGVVRVQTHIVRPGSVPPERIELTNRDYFRDKWELRHPGSWERNDWVWCCEFTRVKKKRKKK